MNAKSLTILLSFTFLFFLSGNGFVYGQEPEVKKEYWGNGKLKSETHYKNGKLHGPLTEWYKNGEKKMEGHFKNGKRERLWMEWSEDGKIKSEKQFKNGKEQ